MVALGISPDCDRSVDLGGRLQRRLQFVERGCADERAAVFVHHVNAAVLPFASKPGNCRRNHSVAKFLDSNPRRVRAVNHGPSPTDVASPQCIEQALRQFLLIQVCGTGCEIQPTQVQTREIPLMDDSKHIGRGIFRWPPGVLCAGSTPASTQRLTVVTLTPSARDTSAGL